MEVILIIFCSVFVVTILTIALAKVKKNNISSEAAEKEECKENNFIKK